MSANNSLMITATNQATATGATPPRLPTPSVANPYGFCAYCDFIYTDAQQIRCQVCSRPKVGVQAMPAQANFVAWVPVESAVVVKKTINKATNNPVEAANKGKRRRQEARQQARQQTAQNPDEADKTTLKKRKKGEKKNAEKPEEAANTGSNHVRFPDSDQEDEQPVDLDMKEPDNFKLPNHKMLTEEWVTNPRLGACKLDGDKLKRTQEGVPEISWWFVFLRHFLQHLHVKDGQTPMSAVAQSALASPHYNYLKNLHPEAFKTFKDHVKNHINTALERDPEWKPVRGIRSTKKALAVAGLAASGCEEAEQCEEALPNVVWVDGKEFERLKKQRRTNVGVKSVPQMEESRRYESSDSSLESSSDEDSDLE